MFATKNVSWSNEKEVRIITDKVGNQRFLPFALTGVVFGTNTSEEAKKKILKALLNLFLLFKSIYSSILINIFYILNSILMHYIL